MLVIPLVRSKLILSLKSTTFPNYINFSHIFIHYNKLKNSCYLYNRAHPVLFKFSEIEF